MHHPPFRTGLDFMDRSGFRDTEKFLALLERYDPVLRVQCGHLHRPITTMKAGTIIATAPSSAHQLILDICQNDKIGFTLEPPSAVLHVWFEDEQQLVSHTSVIGDFKKYDLTEAFQSKSH